MKNLRKLSQGLQTHIIYAVAFQMCLSYEILLVDFHVFENIHRFDLCKIYLDNDFPIIYGRVKFRVISSFHSLYVFVYK